MSTLYGTIILFMPAEIFNFTVITEWFLLKQIEFIFTESMLLSSTLSWAVLAEPHSWLWLSCSYMPSEVATFATLYTSISICQAFSEGMAASTIFTCLFYGCFYLCR